VAWLGLAVGEVGLSAPSVCCAAGKSATSPTSPTALAAAAQPIDKSLRPATVSCWCSSAIDRSTPADQGWSGPDSRFAGRAADGWGWQARVNPDPV